MKVQMADHVIWRDLGDEVVILSLANNNYFGLVGAGGQMWRHLAESGSTDLTVEALMKEFDTDAATLRTDLQVLVRELEALGLVVVGDDGAKQSPAKAKAQKVPRINRARRRAAVKRRAAKPASAGKRASKKVAPKKRATRKRGSRKNKR